MILSDLSIKGYISTGDLVITPLDADDIQPASVDVHLADQLLIPQSGYLIDPRKRQFFDTYSLVHTDGYIDLAAGEFVLGTTVEHLEVPDFLVARIEGKSSIGRLGLTIHSTAGYVDPGFRGQLTLEIKNNSRNFIRVYDRMKIAQLSFLRMTTAAERPYGTPGLKSRYQDQVGVTGSRFHSDYV